MTFKGPLNDLSQWAKLDKKIWVIHSIGCREVSAIVTHETAVTGRKTLPGHVKEALYAVLQQFDFATSFMWDMKSRMLTTHAQVTQKDYASTWVPRPRPRPHQTSYQDNFVIVYVWFCPNEKVWIKFKNRETEKKFLKNLPVFQRVPTQTQCNFKHSRKKIVEEWKVLWWHSVRWRNSCQQHCQSQICTQAVIVWLTYRSITNLWILF